MMTSRTPPEVDRGSMRSEEKEAASAGEEFENQFKVEYKVWRRKLQKAASSRIKILRALDEQGDPEAAEQLGSRPRYLNAKRCNSCPGCQTMLLEKSCGTCSGCNKSKGCIEYSRLCFNWEKSPLSYHDGSAITTTSSIFDLTAADLTKYREIVRDIGEAAIELDELVNKFPPESDYRTNPRYCRRRLDEDVSNEEIHLQNLESMMSKFQEHQDRLLEFDSETPGDAIESTGEARIPGPSSFSLTNTATQRQLMDWGLFQSPPEDLVHPSSKTVTIESEELEKYPARPMGPPAPTTVMLEDAPETGDPPAGAPRDVHKPPKPPLDSMPSGSSRETVGLGRQTRHRSQSELPPGALRRQANTTTITETARDRLFRLSTTVEVRKETIATGLIGIEEALAARTGSAGHQIDWVREELSNIQVLLSETEDTEMEVWLLTARVRGEETRTARARIWATWSHKMIAKITEIKKESWASRSAVNPGMPPVTLAPVHVCARSTGHVEKVRLPNFSGRVEEYADFKQQFQQLCAGEKYSPVIELAQLRHKLPKEGLAAIVGLRSLDTVWSRLDEAFGNREMSILTTMRKLRNFKTSKARPADQILELCNAVQQCRTVLEGLDALGVFLSDRETVATVVHSLPSHAQERWYQRREPTEETHEEKGKVLLDWLEHERASAVKVRLDDMARRLQTPSTPSPKAESSTISTDMGLYSASTLAPSDAGSHSVIKDDSNKQDDPGNGGMSGGGARGPVVTAEMADEITARRLTNLTAKKLESCPICKEKHFFEKTWARVSPAKVTKMLSTHLTSCPKFLGMSGPQRAVAVTSHGACIHCTAWDHAKHKGPGGTLAGDPRCKTKVQGTECGGKHGMWFHSSTATTGTLSLDSTLSQDRGEGPGLYEVYRVNVPCVSEGSKAGTVFVDPGSDTNYIRHDFAQALGIVGTPHVVRIKVVDMDYRVVQTARYEFELEDRDGTRHLVRALGLGTITTLPREPDLTPILPLLHDFPPEVVHRPDGQVDILLGLPSSSLHGRHYREWGNMRLLQARFGCGWVLRGCHDNLSFPHDAFKPALSAEALAISRGAEVTLESHTIYHTTSMFSPATEFHEFHEINELGTKPAPACTRCEGCQDCTFRRKKLSQEDREVVSRIEASMSVDDMTGVITAQYPWKPCVSRMTSNEKQAEKVQSSIEKHMIKAETHGDYLEEMEKAITEGKVREITEEEKATWHGPVHYISTFASSMITAPKS